MSAPAGYAGGAAVFAGAAGAEGNPGISPHGNLFSQPTGPAVGGGIKIVNDLEERTADLMGEKEMLQNRGSVQAHSLKNGRIIPSLWRTLE